MNRWHAIQRTALIAFVAAGALGTGCASAAEPSLVRVEQTADGWQLIRNGEPLFIKGTGGGVQQEMIASSGGNGFRTWGIHEDTMDKLDSAQAHGLSVTLGFWLPHRGPKDNPVNDYADPAVRQKQLDRLRADVLKYRDHPALLIWALGNETEQGNNLPEYWSLLNEMALLVKELDPNHPTMTVTADIGGNFEAMLAEHAPAIDIWGINSYAGLFTLRERLDRRGYNGPFIVTEFGPRGHWEVPRTPWGAAIEQSSTEKAGQYAWLYENVIVADPRCLGSYVFLWGQKHEATETWFSMFSRGRPTELVDTMHRMWRGSWPDDLAPKIISLNSDLAMQQVGAGESYAVKLEAFDPEGRPLTVQWEIQSSVRRKGQGIGEEDDITRQFRKLIDGTGVNVNVTTPDEPGDYRLFAWASDPGGKVATINVPFRVRDDADAADHPSEVQMNPTSGMRIETSDRQADQPLAVIHQP